MADSFWLALRRVHGIGPLTAHLLLERFGSAEAVFQQVKARLSARGVRPHAIYSNSRTLRRSKKGFASCPKSGQAGQMYRRRISGKSSPYCRSAALFFHTRHDYRRRSQMCRGGGSRTASDGGRRMAQRLGLEFAAQGFTVVSGLARGIDSDAHQGALDARGKTVAVLGCGVDVIYPPENRKLAEAIIEGEWSNHFGVAYRHAADCREFSRPQPSDLWRVPWRRYRRGSGKKRLADHRADGARTGSPGLRRAR